MSNVRASLVDSERKVAKFIDYRVGYLSCFRSFQCMRCLQQQICGLSWCHLSDFMALVRRKSSEHRVPARVENVARDTGREQVCHRIKIVCAVEQK